MANNEDYLVPFNKLTEEEQRKIASKGGKASAKARREKKEMKEQISLLLSLPLKDKQAKAKLKKMGIDADNLDNQMVLIVKMFQTAIGNGKNQVSAATFLRDTVGEKPKDVFEFDKSVDETINEVDDYLCKKKKS